MKKAILALIPLFFLTACPNEKETRTMMEGLAEKKSAASDIIDKRSFELESLLKTQDYFFDFTEKVHLIVVDSNSADDVRTLIQNIGAKNFCERFVLSTQKWQVLQLYCATGDIYKCSPEILEYSNTYKKMQETLGPNLLAKESSCQ